MAKFIALIMKFTYLIYELTALSIYNYIQLPSHRLELPKEFEFGCMKEPYEAHTISN